MHFNIRPLLRCSRHVVVETAHGSPEIRSFSNNDWPASRKRKRKRRLKSAGCKTITAKKLLLLLLVATLPIASYAKNQEDSIAFPSKNSQLLPTTDNTSINDHHDNSTQTSCETTQRQQIPHYHTAECQQPSSSGLLATNADCGTEPVQSNSNPINGSDISEQQMDLWMGKTVIESTDFAELSTLWIVKDWDEILLRVCFVVPIVLLGVLGNLTIIYSMFKFKPFRSKPTNIFILNTALADLLTTIVCPNAALLTDIYQFYVLGAFVCRFEGFIKITCLLVSAYSLIVLSTDWLLCVVEPCRSRISVRKSWLAFGAIWIISVFMASPLIFWRHLRERQWKDVLEIWCCEMIHYSKYYWVGITLFLIYLPTFFMTIVLIIILLQMDKFEAKLKKSRAFQEQQQQQSTRRYLPNLPIFSPQRPRALSCTSEGGLGSTSRASSSSMQTCNSLQSISMKYRRRIVKILFTYLLTSIICWTPLQFVIIYRHFRSETIPSPWFFELAFFASLAASLSSAMNPIIFGFLSEPFRRIVTKSWLFRAIFRLTTNHIGTNPQNKQAPHNNNNRNTRRLGPQHSLRSNPAVKPIRNHDFDRYSARTHHVSPLHIGRSSSNQHQNSRNGARRADVASNPGILRMNMNNIPLHPIYSTNRRPVSVHILGDTLDTLQRPSDLNNNNNNANNCTFGQVSFIGHDRRNIDANECHENASFEPDVVPQEQVTCISVNNQNQDPPLTTTAANHVQACVGLNNALSKSKDDNISGDSDEILGETNIKIDTTSFISGRVKRVA